MFASLETWVDRVKKALEQSPVEIDDRLPSEYSIGSYALRGYRGPAILIATRKCLGAKRADGFIQRHAAEMKAEGFRRVSRDLVERDCKALEDLANTHDAVEIAPAY